MKRFKYSSKLILLSILFCFIVVFMSGCGEIGTNVENLMKITDDFVGERIITVNLGNNFDIESETAKNIKKVIEDNCPPNMSYRAEDSQDGYKYVFVISFSSLDEYKAKVASVIGRKISVAYGYTNSVLSKGTYYREDYDGIELVSWIADNLDKKGYKDIVLDMKSTSDVVNYNNEVFSSPTSVMNTSTVKGEPVHNVTIYTVNHKNGSYDRTMVLTVPKQTYEKLNVSLENLMKSRISSDAKNDTWTDNGGYMEYSVKYENIDIDRMKEYTKLFLDCYNEDLYYGDQNQSSTLLAEQLVFEENINVLSMVSDKEDGNVQINYNYTLPDETTHGEGAELKNGEWATLGSWTSNTYTFIDTTGVHDIRIPDGMQYTIKGINITLTSLGDDSFKRVVDLVYNKKSGEQGMNYAYNFLVNKGVTTSKESDDEGIICRIIHQGTSNDISADVGDLFGSGNYFSSSQHINDLSVVNDIEFSDNINIGYMLTGSNANIKINYSALTESNESIRNIKVTDETEKKNVDISADNNIYTATVIGGNLSVEGLATRPNLSGIILYCGICGIIIIITFSVIIFCVRHNKKLGISYENKPTTEELKNRENEEIQIQKTHKTNKSKEETDYENFLKDYYNDL